MKRRSLKTFLEHFCTEIRADKKFCFILGAGASKQSGIPTGEELVDTWMKELKQRYEDVELRTWQEKEKINPSDLASSYSKIYDKRFELDKKDGFAYLEKLMEGREPSCGYSVLAQILDRKPHKIVITTNFDSLVEDALFIYTQKKPLVVGHESLADYIKPFSSRPLIVKIHRDLFLSPMNSETQTGLLAENFKRNLEIIFRYYTPLVIGYGGNDGSLMGFLEALNEIEGGIFWFYREQDGELNPRIQKLIGKFGGCAIPMTGFDELMIQIGNKLGFERVDKSILEIADRRAKYYREQIELVDKSITGDADTKSALSDILSRGEKDWFYYQLLALKENKPEKRERIYKEAIKKLPKSYELLVTYAIFLTDIKKDYAEAEELFKKAIELKPDNPATLYNYATFLHRIRKQYDKAEELYKKAIELEPDEPTNFSNYATFLENIRKDYDKAEELYEKAIKLKPNDISMSNNYASFLSDVRKDYDKAEELYKKAIELRPDSANAQGNYAKLLIERERIDEAREAISKSFEAYKRYGVPDVILPEQLLLELWFYCYAIFYAGFPESKENIETLLNKGVRSPGWNLEGVLKVAKKREHPEYSELYKYAQIISEIDNK